MNRHLNDEEAEQYSLGLASEGDVARMEEHLLLCEACRSKITESDSYVATMQQAASTLRRSPRPEARTWFRLPLFTQLLAAAAVTILLATGLHFVGMAPRSTPFAVNLSASRGSGIEANAPAGQSLRLQLDLSGLLPEPSFRLQVVDRTGREVWQGSAVPKDSQAVVSISPLPAGVYFIRAYGSGQLLREYGLNVSVHQSYWSSKAWDIL